MNSTRLRRVAVLSALAVGLIAPGSAAADSTVGVADLENAEVSGTLGQGQPPPYSLWASGYRDGPSAFYASEDGFLTEVGVAHWNTADVTVKILILRPGAGISLQVIAAPMTMLLPATPAPGVITTLPVAIETGIAAGDRIGMVPVSGGSSLHAITDNSSPVLGPGTYPASAPGSEPGAGSIYDFAFGSANGPLIRGTVAATPGGGQAHTKPLASPTKTAFKPGKKFKWVKVAMQCIAVNTTVTYCRGTTSLENKAPADAAEAAGRRVLGSASYNIPAGTTKRIKIPLRRAARKKLAKRGKLRPFLVIREEVSGKTLTSATRITIKGKKKKKRKR